MLPDPPPEKATPGPPYGADSKYMYTDHHTRLYFGWTDNQSPNAHQQLNRREIGRVLSSKKSSAASAFHEAAERARHERRWRVEHLGFVVLFAPSGRETVSTRNRPLC